MDTRTMEMGDGWMAEQQDVVVAPEEAEQFAFSILLALGFGSHEARIVAGHLVGSHLAGHDSHGLQMLRLYVDQTSRGEINVHGTPQATEGACAIVSIDGNWGFGHVAGELAVELGTDLAAEYGIAATVIRRANHFGRLGHYVEEAARRGCASIGFIGGLGGPVQAAPFGGARAAYGANPVFAGFPTDDPETPFVLDFATTKVAGGKVILARTRGESLAEGLLFDRNGTPTTDPAALFDGGALAPFGEHKGYALALLAELLGPIMTDSYSLASPPNGGEYFGRQGVMIVFIHVGSLRDAEATRRDATTFLKGVTAVPPVPPYDRVMTPGQPEAEMRARRQSRGIDLSRGTVEVLRDVAIGFKVALPSWLVEQ